MKARAEFKNIQSYVVDITLSGTLEEWMNIHKTLKNASYHYHADQLKDALGEIIARVALRVDPEKEP